MADRVESISILMADDVDAYLAKPINCERLIKVMKETATTVMDELCL